MFHEFFNESYRDVKLTMDFLHRTLALLEGFCIKENTPEHRLSNVQVSSRAPEISAVKLDPKTLPTRPHVNEAGFSSIFLQAENSEGKCWARDVCQSLNQTPQVFAMCKTIC